MASNCETLEFLLRKKGMDDVTVEERIITKAEGKVLGYCVHQNGNPIVPVIYPNDFSSYQEMANAIISMKIPQDAGTFVQKMREFNYEEMENHILLCACNADNVEFLKDKPHLVNEELGVAAYVRMINGTASATVTNNLARSFGFDPQVFVRKAVFASEKHHPIEIESIPSKLGLNVTEGEFEGPFIAGAYHCEGNYYYGAGILFYPSLADSIRTKFGEEGEVYVIPSSVHELILMPQASSTWNDEAVSEMVNDVNLECVDPGFRLAACSFKMDLSTGKLTRCLAKRNEGKA